jgi:preprotein translocase subunit Sec61beta
MVTTSVARRAHLATVTFIYRRAITYLAMAKDKKGSGFQSAAGLIRYFDAEDETALKIPPWAVVAMMLASIILVYVFDIMYPT